MTTRIDFISDVLKRLGFDFKFSATSWSSGEFTIIGNNQDICDTFHQKILPRVSGVEFTITKFGAVIEVSPFGSLW